MRSAAAALFALSLAGVLFVTSAEAASVPSAIAVGAGTQSSGGCALYSGGTVRCWGVNTSGQLGNGTTMSSSTAVAVKGLSGVRAISTGSQHSCAVRSGGSVECWGFNYYGQLGDGTTTTSSTPVAVKGLSGATAVSAGYEETCALLSGGTVKCWGDDSFGDLGNGTTVRSLTPVAVKGLSGARAISTEGQDACALLSGGTVKCWGDNGNGRLGNPNYASQYSPTPIAVSGITNAIAVNTGTAVTCALLSGGSVECWGPNGYGVLGTGATGSFSSTPIAIKGLNGAKAVSNGTNTSCALLSGGTVKCWGSNSQGQFGNGTSGLFSAIPVAVKGLSNALVVSAGDNEACALLSGGTVKCWGVNNTGQLGNGTITSFSSTPIAVKGL